jgi:hypothetical protein
MTYLRKPAISTDPLLPGSIGNYTEYRPGAERARTVSDVRAAFASCEPGLLILHAALNIEELWQAVMKSSRHPEFSSVDRIAFAVLPQLVLALRGGCGERI